MLLRTAFVAVSLHAARAVGFDGASNGVLDAADELASAQRALFQVRAELAATKAELEALRDRKRTAENDAAQIALSDENASEGGRIWALGSPGKYLSDALHRMHLFPMLAATLKLGLFDFLQKGDASFSELRRGLNVSAKGLDGLLESLIPTGLVTYDHVSRTFALQRGFDEVNITNFRTTYLGLHVSTQVAPAARIHASRVTAAPSRDASSHLMGWRRYTPLRHPCIVTRRYAIARRELSSHSRTPPNAS